VRSAGYAWSLAGVGFRGEAAVSASAECQRTTSEGEEARCPGGVGGGGVGSRRAEHTSVFTGTWSLSSNPFLPAILLEAISSEQGSAVVGVRRTDRGIVREVDHDILGAPRSLPMPSVRPVLWEVSDIIEQVFHLACTRTCVRRWTTGMSPLSTIGPSIA
jgi:hypothetical protein